MAQTKKLLGEIDQTCKKVQEHLKEFRSLFDKVYTLQGTLREKAELDLRWEIKKLQKFRDSIKNWQIMQEIKDKDQINEHRRLIEIEMDKYKTFEREIKTKQYSNEGLEQKEKVDPQAAQKEEIHDWINECIRSLNEQKDNIDAQIESIRAGGASGKKRSKGEETKDLENKNERHSYHVEQLEKMLRAMDNETITIQQIRDIQDGVKYYVEENSSIDFQEDEELYSSLDLDALIPIQTIEVDIGEGSESTQQQRDIEEDRRGIDGGADSDDEFNEVKEFEIIIRNGQ
ncbi:MAG: putative CCR4-NOT transcription complex subunit 3 [Streblomastix strix]|uniref:Putative CCR4-NOT transcription complex subunit 3 n=1 Tax=Streblomastix strix TaxID=222440 RepID=A0A5J4W2P4_9EUKA|nr:MAG: putative CCR4-NOT transcription complex subunit 3 [Streblomastix strix]